MSGSLIDRRELIRRTAAFGVVRPVAGLPRPAAAEEAALVARCIYFDDPDYQNVQISPDGEHIAYLAPLGGVRNLWLAPLSDPQAGKPLTHASDRDIGWVYRWACTNRHLIFFRDHDGDENWRASSVDIASGDTVSLTPESGVKSFMQEIDPRFPDEALLRHNERDKHFFDLFRVHLVSGKSELIYENPEYVWLVTDSHFRLRLGGRYAENGNLECPSALRMGAGPRS